MDEAGEKVSRRERERRVRRCEILRAAEDVFAEKGFANATLDEVAQRAEFGKGTLYNYFEGGKEDILFAIFNELYDDLCALIEASFAPERSAGRPFRDVFQGFVASCLAFFLERQAPFVISMKEAQHLVFNEDTGKAQYFHRQRERVADALTRVLEAAVAQGELKALPPHAVAHLVMGNISGLQMHLLCFRAPGERSAASPVGTPEDAARFLTTLLLDGLLAHPQPSSSPSPPSTPDAHDPSTSR